MAATSTKIVSVTPPGPSHAWHHHGHAAHEVHFYADDSFLLEPLSRFVGTALVTGDAALVIATPEHRAALTQRLNANGLDTASALRRGRFVELDARATLTKFMAGAMPDPVRFTEVVGAAISRIRQAVRMDQPHIAAFGEMVALLWQDGNGEAAVRLEQLWNALSEEHLFSLHCAYPVSCFQRQEDSDLFHKICSEHSAVIPDETFTALPSEDERLRSVALLQHHLRVQQDLAGAKQRLEAEVAARSLAEQKLRLSEESLRALSGDLLRTQDEERRRMGGQLHDSVAQYLAAIKMNLHLLKFDVHDVQGASAQIAECAAIADKAITEIRAISYLLYPPMLDEMGLRTAVEWYLHGFAERTGMVITLNISQALSRLPRGVELCLFRLIQEALANVHLHSGSSTAQVAISEEYGMIRAEIRDQGCGIHPVMLQFIEKDVGMLGVGLRGMDERVRQLGGSLRLSSSRSGAVVTAMIPSP